MAVYDSISSFFKRGYAVVHKYSFQIAGKGLEKACLDNEVIYSAINTYDGKLTCKNVADSFSCYEYVDIREVCK